jgi:hypothetical protein
MGDERTFRGPPSAPLASSVRQPADQEVAMLAEALGLLEWTAISAVVTAATATLAMTVHGVLSRDG